MQEVSVYTDDKDGKKTFAGTEDVLGILTAANWPWARTKSVGAGAFLLPCARALSLAFRWTCTYNMHSANSIRDAIDAIKPGRAFLPPSAGGTAGVEVGDKAGDASARGKGPMPVQGV